MTAAESDAPAGPGWPPAVIALDLARQMVAEWRAIGAQATRASASDDPTARLRLEIAGAGKQQREAAELAGQFALVSIAEDLRAIRDVLLETSDALDRKDDEDGAIADARRTREHMRDWQEGKEDHRGEGM